MYLRSWLLIRQEQIPSWEGCRVERGGVGPLQRDAPFYRKKRGPAHKNGASLVVWVAVLLLQRGLCGCQAGDRYAVGAARNVLETHFVTELDRLGFAAVLAADA